jgi:uncharacterized membrane protein required for colicin V production
VIILNYILDISVIVLVVTFAIIGYKKGFIITFFSLTGVIIALILSLWISSFTTDIIYDTFIKSKVETGIANSITETSAETVSDIKSALPDYIVTAADGFGIDLEDTIKTKKDESDGNSIADGIAKSITEKIAKPFIKAIISLILFIVIFIVIKFLLKFIIKALNIFSKLPLLNTANKVLGLVTGLAEGVVIAVISCFILKEIIILSSVNIFGINAEILNDTYIFGRLGNILNKLTLL